MNNLSIRLYKYINNYNPWTNVYGLSRSLLALSMFLTLLLNKITYFFPFQKVAQSNGFLTSFSIFSIFNYSYVSLVIIKIICLILLGLVIIGWRPQITCIFHWWIAYSMQNSALTLDGGEQIAAVFTLLLLPIALTDPRKWHWSKVTKRRKREEYFRCIPLVIIWMIRVQIAILYLDSVIQKLFEEDWVNGSAVYYYLNDNMLGLPKLLHKLFDFVLDSSLVVIPTYLTLAVQTLLVLALFAPKRYWSIILTIGVFMHELFAVMLGLVSFSINMLSILILYLKPLEKPYKFKKLNRLTNHWFKNLQVRFLHKSNPNYEEAK
ncbi:sporulation-delaying protein SdpB family protein [Scopulibacillus cellulosilyticus]|uniref:Sporulation-delaying protein SdpB family protein n=1 Tax=Scopulibacillus cellulosilyticus TaxID=2665665 RepID=A0ABW2Q126_9BACL